MGFLVSVVGDLGVGEGVVAVVVIVVVVVRVIRRRTESFFFIIVVSFFILFLLRRCREFSWLFRVFLRDNLLENVE